MNPIEGITIHEVDKLTEIHATIDGPEGTPFHNGQFHIKLVFSPLYPHEAPKGFFLTRIFHPNISKKGEICVNTLKRDWKATLGLRHVLLVIRCLMIEPNPDSALNAEAGRLIQEDFQAYCKKASMMTQIHGRRGLSVNSTNQSTSMVQQPNSAIVDKQTTVVDKQQQFPSQKQSNAQCKENINQNLQQSNVTNNSVVPPQPMKKKKKDKKRSLKRL